MDETNFQTQNTARQTSIFVPNDLWITAKQNLIEFKSALIFGIKFMVAEKQGFDYPQNKLTEKIAKLQSLLNQKNQEIENLKSPVKIDAVKEADDILKDLGVGVWNGRRKETEKNRKHKNYISFNFKWVQSIHGGL